MARRGVAELATTMAVLGWGIALGGQEGLHVAAALCGGVGICAACYYRYKHGSWFLPQN